MTQALRVARLGAQDRATRILVVAGVALSLLVFVLLRHLHLEEERRNWQADADAYTRTLRDGFQRPAEVAHAVPPLLGSHNALDEATFQRFAVPLVQRHTGIAYVEWAPRVTDADRAAFEEETSRFKPGFFISEPKGGAMVRAPARPVYYPLLFTYPMDNMAMGLDVTFEPVREATARRIAESHTPGVSGKFRLVEDPEGVYSIALYSPVYRQTGDVRGFLVQLYRLKPTVERILGSKMLGTVGFAMRDEDAASEADAGLYETAPGLVERAAPGRKETPDEFRRPFLFEGRNWSVAFFAPKDRFRTPWPVWGVLVAGLLLTTIVAAGRSAMLHLRRLERAVREARELGQYRLVRELGSGGMGAVYVAEHAMLRRPTAVKLVKHTTEDALLRFEREVMITSQLSHPNTIAIYDYGRTPEGTFYYAMEYLEGVDLRRFAERHAPLPVARSVHIVGQAVDALAEAHAHGLIHRDVKPANIMLTERGGIRDFVKVLDFGLAEEERAERSPSDVAGTAGYMAPEAFTRPEELDSKVDVYAIGVVLYELLTGKPPISGTTFLEIATNTLTEVPRPPSSLVSDVPPSLDRVVLRCFAREPDDRWTMSELGAELKKIALEYPWSQAAANEFWNANTEAFASGHDSSEVRSRRDRNAATFMVDFSKRA